jgi:hypothetical protein
MAPATGALLAAILVACFSSGCAGGSIRSRTAAFLGAPMPGVDLGATLFSPQAQGPRHPRHRPPGDPPGWRDDEREEPRHDMPFHDDHRGPGTMLGVNLGPDNQPQREGGAFVFYWMVNRCLDFFDIFTLTVGGGPAMHAEVHVTDAFRFGLGGGLQATFGLSEAPGQGGFYKRSFFEAAVGPVQVGRVEHSSIVSSVRPIDEKYDGISLPEDYLYQAKRDYWSVGASAAAFVVGAQVEIHFLQMFDWFAGFALADPLRDDI